MKLPIFVFAGNPINKIRVVIDRKDTIMLIILVLQVIFTSVCTLFITSLDIFRLGYILSHTMG